jgi:uncharacterized membrane protein
MEITTTRAEFKQRAKTTLKGNYWYAFGVTILVLLISGIAEGIVQLIAKGSDGGTGIAGILSAVITLFVSIPLGVGVNRFFIKISQGNIPQVSDVFYVYKSGLLNTIIVMVVQGIFIFLWSLLLVIPGIIKSYQYFMIDYLLADNPNLNRKRAFEITKAMMRGNKWRTFVLGLSFILWILLCAATCGIGYFFLAPYVNTTFAHYYLEMKQKAIESGVASAEELNA